MALAFPLQASLRDMAGELMQNNAALAASRAQVGVGELNHIELILSKSWEFNYQLRSADTKLANFSGAGNSSPFDEVVHSFGVSREFLYGSTVSLGNILARRETSDRGTRYRFLQEIGLRQSLGRNFFGFEYRKDLERSELAKRLNQLTYEEDVDGKLLELVQAYYQAAQHLALIELQKEAQLRARRRLAITRRRVQDGLRQQVDLYQTRANLHLQEEAVGSANLRLQSALESLASLLHRSVSEAEVTSFRGQGFIERRPPSGEAAANRSLERLRQQQRISQSVLERSKLFLTPKLELSTFYRTSQVQNVRADALSEGSLARGDRSEVTVALDLTWAWGRPYKNTDRLKARLHFETARKNLQSSQTNLDQAASVLKRQIAFLQENIASVKERLQLSQRALGEYNRLYDRGRANLDQVIRAEETFIETEISYINYLAQRELSVYRLSHLYGKLQSFIQGSESQ